MAHSLIDWTDGPDGETGPIAPSAAAGVKAGYPFPPPYLPTPTPFAHTMGVESGGALTDEVNRATGAPTTPPAVTLPFALALVPVFESDIYDRVHVIPRSVALGNVLQQQQRTIEVWNAHSVAKTLSSIGGVGTAGITLGVPTPPGATPANFPPLSSFIYSITVSTTGPAVIDAVYTFNFSGGETPLLEITGSRVVMFPFSAQRPLTEELEWKTDILESYDGTEQRVMARARPRQVFEMDYKFISQVERTDAYSRMIGHSGRTYGVPLWHFARQITSAIAPGATSIPVNTTNADFRSSTTTFQAVVALWRSYTDFEVVQVAVGGVSAGSIALERPVSGTHPLGTEVIPIFLCLPKEPMKWRESVTGVQSLSLQWRAEPITDLSEIDGNLTLYQGIPVMTGFNYVDGELEEELTRKYDFFESEAGVFEAVFGRTIPELTTVKGFRPTTEAEAWSLRKLLYALRGRQRSFWLPTYKRDFNLVQTIGSADLSIVVSPVNYSRFVAQTTPWRNIAIVLKDGTTFFRQINNSVEGVDGGGKPVETLTIDSSLGQVVTTAQLRSISYLYRVRSGTDSVKFEHQDVGQVRCEIPIVGVKS